MPGAGIEYNKSVRKKVFLALIGMLVGAGCAVVTPSAPLASPTALPPTSTVTWLPSPGLTIPVSTPTQMPSPAPTAMVGALVRGDLTAVMAHTRRAVENNQPAALADLIGAEGVTFAPFAVGANPPGYNNAAEIIAALTPALAAGHPACRGYNPTYGENPAKALVVFENLDLDWEALNLDPKDIVATGFIFYRRASGWELTFIVPLPDWAWETLETTLKPCP